MSHPINPLSSNSSQNTSHTSNFALVSDSRYVYKKLPNANSIRLLKLQPGQHGPITSSLITVDAKAAPTYSAISYVWGDPEQTVMISVDGKDKPVGVNLRD